MKKLLLSASTLFALATSAMAQCTFDQQYAGMGAGTYPTALAAVSTCTGCGDQTRVVSIVNATDTVVSSAFGPITINFSAMKVLSLSGNPANTTYGTDMGAGPNNMGQWNNTGIAPNVTAGTGCVYISGTEAVWNAALGGGPQNDGVYPLIILVDAQIASTSPDVSAIVPQLAAGNWISGVPANLGGGPITFDTYSVVVVGGTVGILDNGNVALNGHYPNPATTDIVFNLGKREKAQLEVYDMLGSLVMKSTLTGRVPKVNVANLPAGTYVYRLNDAAGTLLATRKLSVVR